MFQNLTGMHALVILAVVILLFGASKLPALAKSVGQSVKILKDETSEDKTDNAKTDNTGMDNVKTDNTGKDNGTSTAEAVSAAPAASAAPLVSDDAAYVAPAQVQAQPQAQRTA